MKPRWWVVAIPLLFGCRQEPPIVRFERVAEIPLRQAADHFIGRGMDLVRDPGGRFYLADGLNHTVWVFDEHGTELQAIGQPGDGPGELKEPISLAISGDTLAVLEVGHPRISLFRTSDGAFLGAIRQPFGMPSGVEFSRDGRRLAVSHSYGGLLCSILSRSGEVLGTYGEHPQAYYVVPVLIAGGHMSVSEDGDLLLSLIRRYEVTKMDWSGRILAEYRGTPPDFVPLDLGTARSKSDVDDLIRRWTPVYLPLQIEDMVMVQWARPGPEKRSRNLDYQRFADFFTVDARPIAAAVPIPCAFLMVESDKLYCLATDDAEEGPAILAYRIRKGRS